MTDGHCGGIVSLLSNDFFDPTYLPVLTQYPVLNPSQGAGNQNCQPYSLYILRRKINEGQQCKSKNKSKNEIHKTKTELENAIFG